MKVTHRDSTHLTLSGVPGTLCWMAFAVVVGLAIDGFVGYLAWIQWEEHGPGLFLLPLSVGMLMGTAFVILGVLQLLARERLVLDQQTGTGRYESNSPIVTTSKPFRFKLENVHSVVISTQTIERSVAVTEPGWSEATECKAVLQVAKPRRTVALDDTQNGHLERVNHLAEVVAGFLSIEVTRE